MRLTEEEKQVVMERLRVWPRPTLNEWFVDQAQLNYGGNDMAESIPEEKWPLG